MARSCLRHHKWENRFNNTWAHYARHHTHRCTWLVQQLFVIYPLFMKALGFDRRDLSSILSRIVSDWCGNMVILSRDLLTAGFQPLVVVGPACIENPRNVAYSWDHIVWCDIRVLDPTTKVHSCFWHVTGGDFVQCSLTRSFFRD